MSISKSRSLVLPLFLLAIGSVVACSEGMDPMPGTGGAPGAGGAATGGGTASGGAAAGGAISTGGLSSTGGTAATGGAAAGGAAAGGAAAGGSSSGGAAAGGAAAGGAAAGGGPGTGGGDAGTGGGGPTVEFEDVAMLMDMRCATCHVAPGSATKPNFSTSDAIKTALNTFPALAQCNGMPLVTAGDLTKSSLAMLVNGACTPGQGGPAQMPPTGKIADAEIQMIEDWISSGAPGLED